MVAAREDRREAEHEAQRLAILANRLFDQHRAPNGREYTNGQIARMTEGRLNSAWISQLRLGQIARPGADKLQALTDAFDVPYDYFLQSKRGLNSQEDDGLRSALAQPLMREVVRNASQLNQASQEFVLHVIDHLRSIAGITTEPEAPATDASQEKAPKTPRLTRRRASGHVGTTGS